MERLLVQVEDILLQRRGLTREELEQRKRDGEKATWELADPKMKVGATPPHAERKRKGEEAARELANTQAEAIAVLKKLRDLQRGASGTVALNSIEEALKEERRKRKKQDGVGADDAGGDAAAIHSALAAEFASLGNDKPAPTGP